MFVNCVAIVKHYFSKEGVGIFYYEQSRNLLTSNKDIMIITVENWVKKTCTSWLSREFTAQWDCPTTNWSLPHLTSAYSHQVHESENELFIQIWLYLFQ